METNVLVVTPVYCTAQNQRLPLLLQNIYCLRQQTHNDFVHVIVDDGSTDNTPQILDNIARTNPKTLVFHKSNGGSSSAVNYGVEKALTKVNPEFITVIHSDDLLTPKSLEMRLSTAQRTKAVFLYTDMIITDDLKRHSPMRFKAPKFSDASTFFYNLLAQKGIPYATMFWSRDFFTEELGGYDPTITSAEDWDIALRSAKTLEQTHDSFTSINEVTAISRMHANNLRLANIRDGIKWKCYQTIFAKHVEGSNYYARLAKAGVRLVVKEFIPEPAKKILRPIRNALVGRYQNEDPRGLEFISHLNCVDYNRALGV